MKKSLLLALLVLSTFGGVLLTACKSTRSPQVSVMTFNIRLSPREDFDGDNCWNNRREAVIRMIGESKPDLFGIQEGYIVQVDYMDENLPDYGRYGVCRDDGLERGEANAIFWRKDRFDVKQCNTYWLSETPDTVSLGWDGACRRIVTWAQLHDKLSGKDVWYFNTHFDHVGKVAREEAGKLIIARIKEASKYIPLDRLSLSPQCGFASCAIGNKLTVEEQWAKLALVQEIAKEVWG